MFCRFAVPLHCPDRVFCYTFSCPVAIAKIALRIRITLVCGFPIPFNCFRAVLFHAFSNVIAIAKITLCHCIALFCRFAVPFNCFRAVLFHAFSIGIAIAKITLCPTIALLRRFLIPFCRLNVVFFYANAVFIAVSKTTLSCCISLFSRFFIPFKCLFQVFCDAYTITIAIAQFILRFWTFLFCRFGVPLYSRLIVREFRIQPPGHILRCCISLICSFFVPFAGLFFIFFNTERLIIAFAQCALRLRITLFGSFFIPHNGIFRILCYTNTVLVTPCHFQLCIWASVFTSRNHVLLKRHLGIADLLKITGILQIVLLGFLLRFLLRFLTQAEALHEAHEFSLFALRPIELKAVHGIFLIAETHSLDLSPQTVPIHTASRRFKPFFNRFCLDGIRDFHVLPTHTDRLQFICKTYFHLNFAHDDSLPMYL